MPLDGKTIGQPTPEWKAQRERIKLPKALLGGTKAMRDAGEAYLPKKASESQEDYRYRKESAVLLNQYKRTLQYLSGQVFQKPVKYQEPKKGQPVDYNQEYFAAFAENVDTQGTNLSMFTQKVFWHGVNDGISFAFTDHPTTQTEKGDDGNLYYVDASGEKKPKTAQLDKDLGLNPYQVLIKAEQVLDAWLGVQNGKTALKSFRYVEDDEVEQADGTRTITKRVRHFTPGKFYVWEMAHGETEYRLVSSGETGLDSIPIAWFRPGEPKSGLTAIPALEDLAEMNVSHWQAYADHQQLMQYGRRPPWIGKGLLPPEGSDTIPLHPGTVVHGDTGCDLKNVGIDSSSIEKSLADLKTKEDYMALYGLQMVVSNTGTMTATQAGIAAAASDSTLKGWVQLLTDTMENALRYVAEYNKDKDGPAVSINTEFRISYDAALLTLLSSMADKAQLSVATLLETMRHMGVFPDEFDRNLELKTVAKEQAEKAKRLEFTPPFGSFPGDGGQNNSNVPG